MFLPTRLDMCLHYIMVKYFIEYCFLPSTVKWLLRIFGNCALVQSCILSTWPDCVYIHLVCRNIGQLYGGLP